MNLEELQYPIGKFKFLETEIEIQEWKKTINSFYEKIKTEVGLLNDEQLDTPYRPNGWTIRQVVHHCADSHMNSIIRFKLALTEDIPTIKPYLEDKWARLADSSTMPLDASLLILKGVHIRWSILLDAMTKDDFEKKFIHPESRREISLKENLSFYAWHCNHHLAHITNLKKARGW